jgi:amino acid adenylation domain-containing protein
MVANTHISPGIRFVEFPRENIEESVVDRFETQARDNPNRIAVQTGRTHLTYERFNRSANQLARFLLRQLDDDRPIAILMDHDLPAVIAIFSALKASKIFILLDPALPHARIKQILEDSGTILIVTNDQNLPVAEALLEGKRRIVNVDRCNRSLSTANLNLRISPDRISHILYTSGSTGQPKGVIRTHRNDLQNIRNRTNSFCISVEDRITLLGSFSTGQGMTNIYSALLNGATLFPRDLKREGFNGLGQWLIQERITIYHSSTTLFRHFASELDNDAIFPDLRIVNVGGEAVNWKDVELYKKRFSAKCVLVNELSCSEASTFAQFFMNKDTEIAMTVPVGYPVKGKDVLILDENGQSLSRGEIGEIAICSEFLSPGYWNRPDLTSLVFTSDPQSQGRRIYRTGDLGCMSNDGCLEYLGRRDERVKVRGYRVECYEIELALLQFPTVDQAFVTYRQDLREGSQLIAYVVRAKGTSPTVSDLRNDLLTRIPDYMVPAAFVFLDTLPLTATGKIDRSALPKPASIRPPLDASYVSPQSSVEKSVAEICSEILNIDTIGVHDNLFDLGGHSISAMQIVNRVMKTFQVDVPLKCFYDSPTIAGLNALIASSRETEHVEVTLPQKFSKGPILQGKDRQWPILPLVAQEPMLQLEQLFSGLHLLNAPTAYRVTGNLNLAALKQSLALLSDRHECLRTVFPRENGRYYQEILESISSDFDLIDLREFPVAERESKAKELFREDSQRSFDLSRGPLFRVVLFKLSDDDHILAVTLHQLVSDAWSMGIFLRDLAELYRSSLQGNQPQLPELVIQFADFSIWQRKNLELGLMDSQLSYWKEQLCEPLAPLKFSETDGDHDETDFFISRKEISISNELYQSVKTLAREEKTTPYVVLLTALKILLSRYLGQDDIRIGTLVANRQRSEIENLIGHFVNTIIVRTKIDETMPFRGLVQKVKEVTVSAYSNQDLPFEALLQSIENDTTIRCDSLSPLLFIFQNEPQPVILPNLTLSALDNFRKTSTPEVALTEFDIVMSVKEGAEGLSGFLVYKIFALDELMIGRLIQNFERLLERVVSDPNQSVFALRSATEL